MRILRFESVGGASGDMILAALIGLGVDADALRGLLKALPVGDFEIAVSPCRGHGMGGLRVEVRVPHEEHGAASHRGLREIRALIEASGIDNPVRKTSLAVFERLADAEAAVHGVPRDEVHFHEVGAVDAIVDIVGACAGLHFLDIDAVCVGPLPLGSGTVKTAHGVLPVPAPATVSLLRGHPVTYTSEPSELVTPWKDMDAPPPGAAIETVAYAFGHRELQTRPNLLRAAILQTPGTPASGDACLVLECNLDDTVPELLGSLAEQLRADGALDVFYVPAQMKKSRPGTILTVLCRSQDRDRFVDRIFAESTTFGIREHAVRRSTLDRRHVTVNTPYGEVRVKIGSWKGRDITRAPEHGDCARRADEAGVAVRLVYEAALAAAPK